MLGTWKLKSYVVTTAAGARSTPFGDSPTGYLSYTPDGRMQVIGAADGRMAPAGPSQSDEERALLHDTMFAYAGKYSVEPGKVVHHVDISWNDGWTGTDQVRFFRLDGDTLMIKSAPTKSQSDGREGVWTVVWQRVK